MSLGLLMIAASGMAHADPARLAQLVDYVGVDYAVAVEDGQIISESEYGEMLEFGALIEDQVRDLPEGDTRDSLTELAGDLNTAIEARADPEQVAGIATRMTNVLLTSPGLVTAPANPPDLAVARTVYMQQCASCHGAGGEGDGPAAHEAMEPPPTDFTDAGRARARSLYGLFNTITLGVEGTAMPPFGHLTPEQRWALAFYVGSLHADADTLQAGEKVFVTTPAPALPDLQRLSTSTLAGVAEAEGQAAAGLHAWLRANPQVLEHARPDPLAAAAAGVRRSLELYAEGDRAAAHNAAVGAYLEGFELAEAALRTTQPALVLQVETAMMDLRRSMRRGLPVAEVRAAGDEVLSLLETARDSQTGDSLSPWVAFVSALVILLREGLEAILVLGAIAAFLTKTERRDGLPWLHGGWIAALGAGLLTWAVSTYFIAISGATREITEGVTALIAAVVLFYVGFWMHRKLNAKRWQAFLQDSLQRALDHRGLWAIAGIAFIAVYREVFETVLFYQALWAQVSIPAAESAMLGGAVIGGILIVVIAWAVFRFGLRLPLRQFFGVTAAIMITLAIIFAGKGVAALQEAGRLPLDPVAFPRVELLGIYPTWQTLGVQLAVLAAALVLVLLNRRSPQPAL